MAYMHIDNLYKDRRILAFKECYAMEKINGTSAHIVWNEGKVSFFPEGCSYLEFIKLFDKDFLISKFQDSGTDTVTIYGEAYGGKVQAMSTVYGPELRFVAFEVKIGDLWLNVESADKYVKTFGLDFVPYKKIPAEENCLNAERDADSVQAVKNGMGEGHKREGIVLRSPFEVITNNGTRIIAKYKRDDFAETKTARSIDPNKLVVLTEAKAIADEWVTEMRLTHVLDKFPEPYDITMMGDVIRAMIEDVSREAKGEIVECKEVRVAIGRASATLFKQRINNQPLSFDGMVKR